MAQLLKDGQSVRAVDRKPFAEWYQVHPEAENIVADCSGWTTATRSPRACSTVYNLAADMGGMGFIENNKAAVHAVGAHQHAHAAWPRATPASSASSTPPRPASTPPTSRPTRTSPPLTEEDAYPAMPEDGYGWEKLFTERMARHFREDFGLETRVARYHNVYGPHGTWDGGREKAPAAICRKVAAGEAHRRARDRDLGRRRADPQLHVHRRLRPGHPEILHGDFAEPVNLGSSRARHHQPDGRHRRGHRRHHASSGTTSSTPRRACAAATATTRCSTSIYGWEPSITLRTDWRRPTRGSTTSSRRRGEPPCASFHDFAGHPFQAELSRELAARGHDVEHAYATQYPSGKGKLERLDGDPDALTFRGITAVRTFEKYSPLGRMRFEKSFAQAWVSHLEQARPDCVVACNVPLFVLNRFSSTMAKSGQPWVLWHQDLFSRAIGEEIRKRLPAAVGPAAQRWVTRTEKNLVRSASQVVAIGEEFRRAYRRWGLDVRHVSVIPNWAPLGEILPGPRDNGWARAPSPAGPGDPSALCRNARPEAQSAAVD